MEVNPDIFRAYDIRGVVDTDLTPEVARAIGLAAGLLHADQPRIALGRDGRISSPALAEAVGQGLQEAGHTVIDIGVVPTPVLYYATHALATGAGIMVTGSHNPPGYNGLKFVMGGRTLHGEDIQTLRVRVLAGGLPVHRGQREEADLLDGYIARIAGDVRLARPMRVALDAGNGSAGPAALRLLEALGCEITDLYCDIDGRFPNHHPNPGEPENLRDLVHAVRAGGLDLGLALDGDGDRLGVVDERGEVVWPDRQMMLFAVDLLARHPRARILYDVKSSRHLGEIIAAHGGRPEMWKTGHSLLKARMRETGALLAGELAGHIMFAERWYGFDDALYTAARLLEILSRQDGPCSAVFARFPAVFSTPEMQVNFAREGTQFEFMREFETVADFGDGDVTRIDGLRVDWPGGWGLVRASNTTPSLTVRFEADTPGFLEELKSLFRSRIHAIRPGLHLPF